MRTGFLGLSLLLLAAHCGAASNEQSVLAAQQKWIEGYNHRNHGAVDAAEAADFQITFGDGTQQTKPEQLARLRVTPPAGTEYEIALESSRVRIYGRVAVVTGVVVERGRMPGGQAFHQRSRYTDTWIERRGRWQVVASHLSELKP